MDEGNSSPDIPTDALVEILVRLPPNARRRVRLVSRHWREVVDERVPVDMRRSGAKILVVDSHGCTDVLSTDGSRTKLWRDYAMAGRYRRISVVGTYNGIVCLCDDLMPGGAITLANPSTGETLSLPPLPAPTTSVLSYENCRKSWHQAYAFACHPTTGRYKVVHVPVHHESFWEPGTVHVFTLGEASWRDVEAGPGAMCSPGLSSLAAVDGTLYWLTEDAGKIMSFDLDDERVTPAKPLPVPVKSARCRLTKVHARLGIAVGSDHGLVTVWVLEGERWRRRYVVEAHGPRQLAVPHLAHGDYVLTHGSSDVNETVPLYRHKMSGAARVQSGVVQMRQKDGEEVARLRHPVYRTFEYVETKESFCVYSTKTAFEMALW